MTVARIVMPDDIKPVLLRLDTRLHKRVERLAQRTRRSVHAQLLRLIEISLEDAEKDEGITKPDDNT